MEEASSTNSSQSYRGCLLVDIAIYLRACLQLSVVVEDAGPPSISLLVKLIIKIVPSSC